jgi:hypothetical protein
MSLVDFDSFVNPDKNRVSRQAQKLKLTSSYACICPEDFQRGKFNTVFVPAIPKKKGIARLLKVSEWNGTLVKLLY